MAREPGAGDFEQAGGLPLVAAGPFINGANMTLQSVGQGQLAVSQGAVWAGGSRRVGFGVVGGVEAGLEDDVSRLDLGALAKKHDGAGNVMEFAEVSRPGIGEQLFHGGGMDGDKFSAGGAGLGVEFDGDQAGEILDPFAQRGDE